MLFHRFDGFFRTWRGGTRWHLHIDDHVALVFTRQKGFRQAQIGECQRRNDSHIDQHKAARTFDQTTGSALITTRQTGKPTVEPAEEAFFIGVLSLGNWFQQGDTQRRRHAQCQEAREENRHRKRQRKLLIDDPDRATHEGQREEHRRQHHGNPDNGAGNLFHRLAGCFPGRQSLLRHDPLDVLHHHDRVVHQNTDGQYHAEHGHHVDRESDHRHHRKGTQQAHRHHQRRNQRIADVLQEQEHHQEHQHNRLGQCDHNLLDRYIDEYRCVVGNRVFHVLREQLGQFFHAFLNGRGGSNRVGVGGQLNGRCCSRLAIEAGAEAILLTPHFNPGYVGQPHSGPIRVGTQHYIAKFLGGFQCALHHQGCGQFLFLCARLLAKAARRYLDVLRGNRPVDVTDREVVAHQSRWIHPDPHRPLGGEHLYTAHPGQATYFVVDVTRCVIRQAYWVLVTILVVEGIDQQEVAAGLLDLQPLVQYRLWQARLGSLESVLYVYLGQVRVGTRLKGDVDLGHAVGAAG